jgi:hypothetical protein
VAAATAWGLTPEAQAGGRPRLRSAARRPQGNSASRPKPSAPTRGYGRPSKLRSRRDSASRAARLGGLERSFRPSRAAAPCGRLPAVRAAVATREEPRSETADSLTRILPRVVKRRAYAGRRAKSMALLLSIGAIAHRDIRAVAEALADVLAERGLVIPASPASPPAYWMRPRWLTYWGGIASGSMPTPASSARFATETAPRLAWGFDLVTVERWKRERQIRDTSPARRRDRRRSSGLGVAATSASMECASTRSCATPVCSFTAPRCALKRRRKAAGR